MLTCEQVTRRLLFLSSECRDKHIKATHQRMEILRELASTGEHPDAETIFKRVRRRIPAVSLDTVYRTLRMLEDKGIISRVPSMQDRARFEANISRHHHFVCRKCGRIEDFYSTALDQFTPPPAVAAMGRVETVHVELRGLCRACKGKSVR